MVKETDVIMNFFDSLYVIPSIVSEGVTIPWREEVQEYLFSCHTSYITEEMLLAELEMPIPEEAQKTANKDEPADGYRPPDQVIEDKEQSKWAPVKNLAREEAKIKRRSFAVAGGEDDDHEEEFVNSRITISVINFDWIFEGNNCEQFVNLLVDKAKFKVFKQKSVRSFINLLWKNYQPRIVKMIFFPYCVYVAIQLVCTTGIAGYYFSIIEKQRKDPLNAEQYHWQKTSARVLINFLLVVA